MATSYVAGPATHPGYVYLQTSAGVFAAPARYPVAVDPWGMSTGDIDGDGLLDLVVATPGTVAPQINVINNSGGVSVLRQDSSKHGHFLNAQWISTGGSATDAAIAKLDQDGLADQAGLADLVVADGVLANGRAVLYLQDPALPGKFLAPDDLLAGSGKGFEELAVADVNGDSRNDTVLAAYDSVAVFYQLPGGGFSGPAILAAGVSPDGVAVGDLDGNGDNRADIILNDGPSVLIQRATPAGSFEALCPLR